MTPPDSRPGHVVAAVAVAVASVGLVTSYGATVEVRRVVPIESTATGLPRAPTWADEQQRHHDNRLRHAANLAAMAHDRPDPYDAGVVTDAMRADALARRAQNRAYAGAPPTIPHPIDQQSAPNCLACHADGLRVATANTRATAPAMCHHTMQSCTQCHVVSSAPMAGEGVSSGPPIDNRFEGEPSVARGERAWPGAPPTIPHATLMRSRCASCHGALALGLRSSHPWRQSCTQCHGPSAALDQRPPLSTP